MEKTMLKTLKEKTRGLAMAGLSGLSLAGCVPQVKEIRDVTGDGISDVIVNTGLDTYINIGQKDGSYLITVENPVFDLFGAKSLRTIRLMDNRRWVFDGQFYREAAQ